MFFGSAYGLKSCPRSTSFTAYMLQNGFSLSMSFFSGSLVSSSLVVFRYSKCFALDRTQSLVGFASCSRSHCSRFPRPPSFLLRTRTGGSQDTGGPDTTYLRTRGTCRASMRWTRPCPEPPISASVPSVPHHMLDIPSPPLTSFFLVGSPAGLARFLRQ